MKRFMLCAVVLFAAVAGYTCYNNSNAMRYIEKYPDEIEGLIGVDMMVPKLYDAMIRASGVPESIYKEAMHLRFAIHDQI